MADCPKQRQKDLVDFHPSRCSSSRCSGCSSSRCLSPCCVAPAPVPGVCVAWWLLLFLYLLSASLGPGGGTAGAWWGGGTAGAWRGATAAVWGRGAIARMPRARVHERGGEERGGGINWINCSICNQLFFTLCRPTEVRRMVEMPLRLFSYEDATRSLQYNKGKLSKAKPNYDHKKTSYTCDGRSV